MTIEHHPPITGNFFTRHLHRFLTGILPSKAKRMFYLTSAMAVLINNRSPDRTILAKLSKPLKLGYDPASMLFSAYIGFDIWKTLSLEDQAQLQLSQMDETKMWKVSMLFSEKCPDWLQYGSHHLMITDLHDLLSILIRIQPVP